MSTTTAQPPSPDEGPSLTEDDIYHILRNPRRRETLRHLGSTGGPATVRDLSEIVAAQETGEEPPPRDVREAVYISLHQNHLPTLAEHDIVEYDRDRKEVVPDDGARTVGRYLMAASGIGLTWDEFYRLLGICGLLVVGIAGTGIGGLSVLSPVLWMVLFLAVYAVSTAAQLLRYRGLLFGARSE